MPRRRAVTGREKEETEQVAVRLARSLLERVDGHVERLRAQVPGISFSRADAIRSLLTEALDRAEGKKAR